MHGRGAATATRAATVGLLLLLTGSAALAQVPTPGALPREKVSTGPGSYGWPGTTSATNPLVQQQIPGPPSMFPTPAAGPLPLLEQVPSGLPINPSAIPLASTNAPDPLPGSTEDYYRNELDARRKFQYCDYDRTRVSEFPGSLLWESPFGEKRAPRFNLQATTLDNNVNTYTVDNSIGGTIALVRVEPAGSDAAFQLDIFAVVTTRLSPEDLIATDYRFGFPVSFRRGDWHGKLSFEHTSAHLGDEFARNTGRLPQNYSKNEVVAALGRNIPEIDLRLYGQISYAVQQDLAGDPPRFRFDYGFQWVSPYPTGPLGAPYVALHLEHRGDVQYNPNVVAQVGLLIRNPYQRLGNLRFYVEYFNGHSEFGQFYQFREKFTGIAVACDF